MSKDNILLGLGVISLDDVAIGLTRGGGRFFTESEIREIIADGDKGRVKGRVTRDTCRAKLEVNTLECNKANFDKMVAGLKKTGAKRSLKTGVFEEADYHTIKWTGKTMDGKACMITLLNAINTEDIDWSLVEKDEAVSKLIFEACYEDDGEDIPFDIEYVE